MTKIERNMNLLHPKFKGQFIALEKALISAHEAHVTETLFKVFETFRSFERQEHLFSIGTTKARGGQSAHNFGLAVDFVPFVNDGRNGTYSWSSHHDWKFLKDMAAQHGLSNQSWSLRWDKPHVQVAGWRQWKEV